MPASRCWALLVFFLRKRASLITYLLVMLPASQRISTSLAFPTFPSLLSRSRSVVSVSDCVSPSASPSPSPSAKLDVLHAHPWDARLQFNAAEHQYSFEGRALQRSVTNLVQRYFTPFDSQKAVKDMMRGKNWPRSEYCHSPSGRPFTEQEVLQRWQFGSEMARRQGTMMHENIERIFNGMTPTHEMQERPQFDEFCDQYLIKSGIRPYRTEWKIAAPDLSIGGSVDFIGLDKNDEFVLIDWKRSKNLSSPQTFFAPKFALPPLSHIPQSDLSKYMLQLNIYDYILEHYYQIKSKAMLLVSLHPSIAKAFVYEVPKLRTEVELIVKDIQSENADR